MGNVTRFFKKIEKTETCWNWTASTNGRGYGQFGLGARKLGNIKAHRYSWWLHNCDIPDGMCVLHKCDNPTCVNPDHLFLGTKQDNSRDMYTKQRCSLQKYPELYKRKTECA